MIPTYSEANHYQLQAVYFAGAATLLGCMATVHLEDLDDQVFWEIMLEKYSGNKKFNFLYYSQSQNNHKTTGVNQCLKFKPYLSKQFFICIDSDYRYLLQERDINPTNYIFQTYTYSFENHLCFINELNSICEKATGFKNDIFDFEAFLRSYSNAIYEVFIWHLHFVMNDEFRFKQSVFKQIIDLKEFVDLNDNGKVIMDVLIQRSHEIIAKLKIENPTTNIEETKKHFLDLGVRPDNAYLFVRGHNLHDLICEIGNRTCQIILETEKVKFGGDKQLISKLYKNKMPFKKWLSKHIMFDSYHEISKIGTEIHSIFN